MISPSSIKDRFNLNQDEERAIQKRFSDPEDREAARAEYRKCKEAIKEAEKTLAEELKKNPDRPGRDLTPDNADQQAKYQRARRQADLAHRSEVARAIADRDKGLQRIEEAQPEKKPPPMQHEAAEQGPAGHGNENAAAAKEAATNTENALVDKANDPGQGIISESPVPSSSQQDHDTARTSLAEAPSVPPDPEIELSRVHAGEQLELDERFAMEEAQLKARDSDAMNAIVARQQRKGLSGIAYSVSGQAAKDKVQFAAVEAVITDFVDRQFTEQEALSARHAAKRAALARDKANENRPIRVANNSTPGFAPDEAEIIREIDLGPEGAMQDAENISGQGFSPETAEAVHSADFGQEPAASVDQLWTPEDRDAAIQAEHDAAVNRGHGFEADPGNKMEG